ncbi:MAG: porin family protein, partial [Aestuariibacter sp.]|nr:porin family protein [Aestuariibacter sp.]
MKKTSITLALIAAGLVASPVLAQETKPKNWVGGYGMYYSTDAGKPQPAAQIDDGFGIGAEAGFRFDENWAA